MKRRSICAGLVACACLAAASVVSAAPKAKARAGAARVSAAPVQTAHRRSPYVGACVWAERWETKTGVNGQRVREKVWRQLRADGATVPAYPASVTKLMTLLLVLEDVRAGRYTLDTVVTATPDVARSEPSWVGLKTGDRMTVRDLATALMVESANDAAIALAVHASGTFAAFVERMNARARQLGMSATTYYNPNGLPPGKRYPWKAFNVTTAADQALLGRRLVAMPEVFAFTSVKTCDLVKTPTGYRVAVTRQANRPLATTAFGAGESLVKALKNHNNVMRTDKLKIVDADGREVVDGLKTGYIDAGGSSMILTGSRNGLRALVVVLGSASAKERDANARRFLADALEASSW